jgi:TRAP-type C4-dicarboxylate transport system permease small subunit
MGKDIFMKRFMDLVLKADISLFFIAGVALILMMAITLADVAMRTIGKPIIGSVELISFLGALVIGLAIPYTTWTKGHIIVDLVLDWLSPTSRKVLQSVTRIVGIILFILAGYNFILMGLDLKASHTTSGAFKLPLYPIAFGLAISCLFQIATLICDLFNPTTEKPNE